MGQRLDRAGVCMGADMKIEAGKYYRTRGGDVVGPMRRVDWCDATFTAGDFTWNEDGLWGKAIPSKWDLISEVYVSDMPPCEGVNLPATDGPNGPFRVVEETKTLRDEAANAALTGLLAKAVDDGSMGAEDWASDAYLFADAMMEARKK